MSQWIIYGFSPFVDICCNVRCTGVRQVVTGLHELGRRNQKVSDDGWMFALRAKVEVASGCRSWLRRCVLVLGWVQRAFLSIDGMSLRCSKLDTWYLHEFVG